MTEGSRKEGPRGQFPLPSPASCPRLPLPLPLPHRAPVQKALHLLGPRLHPDGVPLRPRFPRKSRSCSWGLPGLQHHTTKPIKMFPATVALGKLGDHWINPVCCFLGSGHFWDRPCTSEWDVIPGEAGESEEQDWMGGKEAEDTTSLWVLGTILPSFLNGAPREGPGTVGSSPGAGSVGRVLGGGRGALESGGKGSGSQGQYQKILHVWGTCVLGLKTNSFLWKSLPGKELGRSEQAVRNWGICPQVSTVALGKLKQEPYTFS